MRSFEAYREAIREVRRLRRTRLWMLCRVELRYRLRLIDAHQRQWAKRTVEDMADQRIKHLESFIKAAGGPPPRFGWAWMLFGFYGLVGAGCLLNTEFRHLAFGLALNVLIGGGLAVGFSLAILLVAGLVVLAGRLLGR